jgi:hypothetical protein
MTIRTLEQLDGALADDLIWRKKELTAFKLLIGATPTFSDRERALLRAYVALLYAHWEGFIKQAGSAYAEYVAFQRLRYEELSLPFVALSSRKLLRAASESSRIEVHLAAVDFLLSRQAEQSSIPYREAIATAGNLSSRVLKEIVLTLGLSYQPFETKANLIDETLLKSRNQLAHGEFLLIDFARYLELSAEVIQMMEEFRTQVSNAAALSRFRRAA